MENKENLILKGESDDYNSHLKTLFDDGVSEELKEKNVEIKNEKENIDYATFEIKGNIFLAVMSFILIFIFGMDLGLKLGKEISRIDLITDVALTLFLGAFLVNGFINGRYKDIKNDSVKLEFYALVFFFVYSIIHFIVIL